MKKWSVGVPDRNIVSQLTLKCGISSLTAAALASKGFVSPQSAAESLNVDSLSDPFLIKDMDTAADVINEAVDNGTKICVYGDYDCDGIMATVILYSYLSELGADVIYYIPERAEGYGLNKEAVRKLAADGVELIVTVDNGISAIDESELIYDLGMRLVVTDHHQTGENLPKAEAVVDPHRPDCFSPYKDLCGAGVALKLVAALDGGDYTMALEQFCDLAAVATVADIVNVMGENRFIISYGLTLVENTDRPAMQALIKVCGLEGKSIDTTSVGFGIAPRINASGRFGSPKTAAELLLCEDHDHCMKLAQEINSLNEQRKQTENSIVSEIYEMINSDPMLIRRRCIFLCGKNWHHGVIGIVASRISEQFGKPCFIASDCDGEIRGSARSFGEFSVFEALTYCSASLEKFGGHPGAGGFTIKNGCREQFAELLEKFALETHKNMPVMTITADSPVTPGELTLDNVKGLSVLEPFGMGNEAPLFYIENAVINEIVPLSNGTHTKLRIKFGFTQQEVLLFRTAPDSLPVAAGDSCNMIVSLGINNFKGNESVSIIVKDIRSKLTQQSKFFAALSAFEAFLRGEQLPQNYYPSMLPSRDTVKRIYLAIPPNGINAETLYFRIVDNKLNYCMFSAAVEALRQLSLISFSSADGFIRRIPVNKKSDLSSAPVLISLNEKIVK